MNPDQPGPDTRVSHELTVTQPGEVTIFSIKRHPIGILVVYFVSAILIAAIAALALAVGPSISGDSDAATQLGVAVLVIFGGLTLIYDMIATAIYWGNKWILTSDSITQINQNGLFHRQSSQLSLNNVEDVTAAQNGLLSQIFNYGLVRVETAGERGKFQFNYCPNPNYYAQQVLAAREAVAHHQHGE